MGLRLKRKLTRIGTSRVLTLPTAWLTYYGDRVNEVTLIGSSLLIIAPIGLEAQAEKLARKMEFEEENVVIK